MSHSASQEKSRFGQLLFVIFALALLMGPGPGILLVNPDPAGTGTDGLLFGVPVIYAWAALWLGVQAIVIGLAYFFLWRTPEDDEKDTQP